MNALLGLSSDLTLVISWSLSIRKMIGMAYCSPVCTDQFLKRFMVGLLERSSPTTPETTVTPFLWFPTLSVIGMFGRLPDGELA